jgi:hypothetical protein
MYIVAEMKEGLDSSPCLLYSEECYSTYFLFSNKGDQLPQEEVVCSEPWDLKGVRYPTGLWARPVIR